ncbi:peptidase M24 [Desulfosarcina alkanivorans]|uniref:Peptidase M24 n=1 Tax=Desulfosarcina alkanivorans TaxID=571177 RepID=A0A5K7YAW7_9BACT|nr:M23 family metallopeptidase [Desulfosarcina alkanivorans]BBO66542.1 peptidase M24 [Desulfosarcina alkanivorans]
MNKKGRSLKPVLLIIVMLLVSIPAVWLAIIRMEGTPPALDIELKSPFIGASRDVSVSVEDAGSGVRKVWMSLLVDGREVEILQRTFPSAGFFAGGKEKSVQVKATVSPQVLGLADGKGVLRVVAWDFSLRKWGKGNQIYLEKEIQIDTRPPTVDLISRAHNLSQGGSGVALYRLSEDCPVSGVTVGDHFFPGYGGHFSDPSLHMAFFALDYQQGRGTRLAVTAEDFAGNRSTTGLVHHINARSFRKDTINLSDNFFNAKMPDFERYFPESASGSRVDLFLKVNRELRLRDSEAIYRITSRTEKEILWDGPFLRLPRSANRARFADHRTYFYGGKVIDRQVHMGIDLAATAQSPVPAANRGKVAFAGDQGIYGNTVILDHGFGLFTLYAHLSQINVAEGQMVEKAEILGKTGKTGLAGGDHLHYSTLVQQTYVNPVEWWDAAWIQNNISAKINDAGPQ